MHSDRGSQVRVLCSKVSENDYSIRDEAFPVEKR